MKNIKIILTILSIVLLSSCSDFLDVKPTNSADSGTSISNANDAKVAINGLMRSMINSNYYSRNFIMYGDAKGGDFAIYSQGRGLDGLYTFNHSQTSGNYGGFWAQMYDCILQVNNLLKNIEKLEADGLGDAALLEYKGQALTARALIYFDLVRLYGKPYNMDKDSYGVPLVLDLLDASEKPIRASVGEVYGQIVNDLTEGAKYVSKSVKKGFLNYYANKAIEARVKLHMNDYPGALAAAEEVIIDKKYTLYANDKWVNSWATAFGSESIFELGVYENEADLGTSSLGYYLLRLAKIKGASGWYMASDYYLERLAQDAGDIRWGIMDYDETSKTRFGSSLKYVGGANMAGDKGGKASATNVKVIRLSEVYLVAAEAALQQSSPDKQKAADYLNQIRKRSPNLELATTATVTLEMIMDEKSKELFAEGHRYFDMLRLGWKIEFNDDFIYPNVLIPHREKIIDRTFYKTILPIPQDEIDANPAIKEQQNPGY